MKKVKKRATTKPEQRTQPSAIAKPSWTFLTNHTHVLLCIYEKPEITIRQIAPQVGITERMVQKIIHELVEAGIIQVAKQGRNNTYEIITKERLRHPLESHRTIGDMLELLRHRS